ncbi:MAG: glycosyltransferase family 2 protein [Actinomycetota bacterium]|nr:glycosyltransferase family 2 protein [Actinomycetota bacterium]
MSTGISSAEAHLQRHGGLRPDPGSGPTPHAGLVAGVVVPTHNDGANIGPLLARLLAEPCIDEIVVVASGCDDCTVATVSEVAAGSPDRVRLYVEAERTGKVAAINFGLRQLASPVVIVVSGDVLPDPGALTRLVEEMRDPTVALSGGRPVPVNDPNTPLGWAVHLLWRLHHRLALHQPKLGEMIALRAEAVVTLPRTSVDEACFQALIEAAGWQSKYVPEAIVRNRGPATVEDFVRQRRQIHTGHLWLRHKQHYAVPSLHVGLLGAELWKDMQADHDRLRPAHVAWTLGAVAMEGYARVRARFDYWMGRENIVWAMIQSTKGDATDIDGLDDMDGLDPRRSS